MEAEFRFLYQQLACTYSLDEEDLKRALTGKLAQAMSLLFGHSWQ